MIDPKGRNVVSITAGVHVVGYNKKAIPENKVPEKWDDFLKPEFRGKKFLVDIRPQGFAALAARMGEEWMVNYARKIKEQEPIWVRGTQALSAMATGDGTMYHLAYYHSCMRAREKQLRVADNLACKVVEPVPIRIGDRTGVSLFAANPHAALLWVEFQASPTAQRIIDANEPLKSSLYVPGSEVNKLVKGKQLAVNDWHSFANTERWMEQAVKAFGFPQAETR
jgi:ABC-type Fe3+ transport system substrate-binding protein